MSEDAGNSAGGKSLSAIIVLACICLASGTGVSLLYTSMEKSIADKEREVFNAALAVVLGDADEYPEVGEYSDPTPDGEGTPSEERVRMNPAEDGVLYCAMGKAKGYSSEIQVLVSVRAPAAGEPVGSDPVVHRVMVVFSSETPGLGENIKAVDKDVSVWAALAGKEATPRRAKFQEQFSGKSLSDLVVDKAPNTDKIAAVTGATISSKAATEAVRRAVKTIIQRTEEVYGR
jgi:Na+-translocating ferredoxin:NAD+ oxidoreductase RnfG subunit